MMLFFFYDIAQWEKHACMGSLTVMKNKTKMATVVERVQENVQERVQERV